MPPPSNFAPPTVFTPNTAVPPQPFGFPQPTYSLNHQGNFKQQTELQLHKPYQFQPPVFSPPQQFQQTPFSTQSLHFPESSHITPQSQFFSPHNGNPLAASTSLRTSQNDILPSENPSPPFPTPISANNTSPQSSALNVQQTPHPHMSQPFQPAIPQTTEWRTKDKCTIVLLGPRSIGKTFLVNTLLSTAYETKRLPTLGRHRSNSNLHSATTTSTASVPPSSPTNNTASISVTHNNVNSMFEFEIIESTPVPPPSPPNSRQEADAEFPLDDSFLNGTNWEMERQKEMQEMYPTFEGY